MVEVIGIAFDDVFTTLNTKIKLVYRSHMMGARKIG